jgi:hypothetical protein
MNTAIFIGVLAVLCVLIFVLGGIFLLWRQGTLSKLISLFIVIGSSYLGFTAIYPQDSFYINDFEEVTGLSLPESVTVLYKSASYPDFQGDYTSEAVFEFSEDSFLKLIDKQAFKEKSLCNNQREMERSLNNILSIVGCKTIQRQGVYFYWNIYSDGKTVYYLYSSS